MKARKSAFTLIELLVVIAIIAILAAILFPVFAQARESAKNTVCLSQARQVGLTVHMYLADHDGTMPIFYAYNSQPPFGQPGHKGTQNLLLPYSRDKHIFRSPLDVGGPFTDIDVPGSNSYWEAYGSSYRFTRCMFSVVAGESSQNNIPMDFNRIVNEGSIQYPSESSAMRAEMFPWFSRRYDIDCSRYGYDCEPPWNFYRQWSSRGGTIIFMDSHARFVTSSAAFDRVRINPEGMRSGDPHPTDGRWYWACD